MDLDQCVGTNDELDEPVAAAAGIHEGEAPIIYRASDGNQIRKEIGNIRKVAFSGL